MPPMKRKKSAMDGRRFHHPRHGECVVLAQWSFWDDSEPPALHAWCYYHAVTANLPDGACDDPDTWDTTPGIFKQLSSEIRSLVNNPPPPGGYSTLHDATPQLRMDGMKKHPVFLELASWEGSEFAAQLQRANAPAHKAALKHLRRLVKDEQAQPGALAIVMKELVQLMGIMADDVRRGLRPSRPAHTDKQLGSRDIVSTMPITLADNAANVFEALLALCGFVEDSSSGEWTPALESALERLFGAYAQPTGVNMLKKMWTFTLSDLQTAGVPLKSAIINPHDVASSTIVKHAVAELGAQGAVDGDGRPLPDYILRNKMEDLWCKVPADVRVRAHAEVVHASVHVHAVKVAAPNGARVVLGARAFVRFAWQGHARKAPTDVLNPFFDRHVARALEEL